MNVASGTELYCYGAGRTFDQQAGSVNGAGKLVWASGWFTFGGGTVTGAVYVLDGVLDVAETAGASTIYSAGNTTLMGNWAEGVTVWVQGNSWYSHATLTTSEGAVNVGTIRLESAHGGYQSAISIGGFDFWNASTGVIEVNTGSGGSRGISGNFINEGLVNATNYPVDISGAYEAAGGRIEGNGRLQSASVSVTASPAQPTTLDLWGNTELLTDNLPNTVLWVHGNYSGSDATLTAAGSVTNRGTILLESTYSSYSETLTVNGTLVNAPEGVIQINQGAGGPRTFNASVVNSGVINVASNTALYLNGTNRVFQQLAGSISASGRFTWADGRFDFIGGMVSGAVHVRNGTLDVAATAGASTIICSGNSTLAGNRAPGVAVWVQGSGTYADATLTTGPGATNAGTIRLESVDSSYQSLLAGSNFVNAASGIIAVNQGAGGPRSISGSFVNQGLVNATNYTVDIYGMYEAAGGRILGGGRLRGASVRVTTSPATPTLLDLWGSTTLLTDNLPNTELWVHGGGDNNTARLTLPQSVTNHGLIRLESTGGGYECRLDSTNWLVNAADGRIAINTGSGGPRTANLNLRNFNTISVGTGLHLTGGATNLTFEQLAGSTSVAGGSAFTWYNGPFRWMAGALAGTVYVYDGTVEIGAAAQAATLRVVGLNAKLVANRSKDAELWVNGTSYHGQSAWLTCLDGAMNLGLIRLESTGGGYNCGLGGNGTLTNGLTGVIESYTGAGGARTLNSSVFNQGTLYVAGTTLVGNNDGQGTNRVFTHAGGRIDCDGFFGWQDGNFLWTGGLINGLAYVRNSAVDVGPGALPSTLCVTGPGNKLLANRSPGAELWVQGNPWWDGPTTLTVVSNAVNLGRIRLESSGAGYDCTLAAQGVLTNGSTGVIESYSGAGGSRYLPATLDNAGTLRAFTTTYSGVTGAQHRNTGRIELNGSTLAFAGTSLLNAPGGVITGTGTLDLSSLSFTNAGTFSPGSSAGRLTVQGQFRQTTTAQVEFEVGGPGQGTGYDWLEITGAATLEGGTLVVRLINNFVPVVGSKYRVLTAAGGLVGQFTTVSNLDVHASRDLQVSYLGTAMDLVAVLATNTITPPTIATAPTSQSVMVGSNATFQVAANGTAPFQYQWRLNGGSLAGATNTLLQLTNVQVSQAGGYSVRVANSAGAVTSVVAMLTVTAPPDLVWRWSGAGDGFRWSDPRNWAANRVPPNGAQVIIAVTNNPLIRMDLSATLASLTCEEALVVQGQTLTLTGGVSVVHGPLTLDGSTLTVDGAAASFVADGTTTVTNCHFYAKTGGRLSITSPFVAVLQSFDPVWQATGPGSVLDLSGVTNVVQSYYYSRLFLQANNGGRLDFSHLTQADASFNASADGVGSVVDMSGLTGRWSGAAWYYGLVLDAQNGGSILISRVKELDRASLTLRTNTVVPLSQLTYFSGTLNVQAGVVASMTNITTLSVTNGDTWLTVTGPGGVLDLSGVTNVVQNGYYTRLFLQANNGGRLDLSHLAQADASFNVSADGAGSVVDMSGLPGRWSGAAWYYALVLDAQNGGSILISRVKELDRVSLTLRTNTVVPLSQLTYFSGTLNVQAGVAASLTNITTLSVTNGDTWLTVTGPGSVLDLSGVTNVVQDGYYTRLFLQANNGGRLNLSHLAQADASFNVAADGVGSVVDLSGLPGRWSGADWYYGVVLDARNGGSILIPRVTELDRVSLTLWTNSVLPLSQLTYFSGTLSGQAGVVVNLTNITTLWVTNGDLSLTVSGPGSVLNLSGVTNVVQNGYYSRLFLQANNGGWLDLSGLAQADASLYVAATGGGSVVELTSLAGRWSGENWNYGLSVDAGEDGSIWLPEITEFDRGTITVRNTGWLLMDWVTRLTRSSVTANSTELVFPVATVMDGSSLSAVGGAVLRLPTLTSLLVTNGNTGLYASGAGSLIDLSAVTAVTVAPDSSLGVSAVSGGQVDLSRVATISDRGTSFYADGTGSMIDLATLVRYNGGSLEGRYGGFISTPRLRFLDRANLVFRGAGRLDTAQMRILTSSQVTIDGTVAAFPTLFNWTGTTFHYSNGGQVRLPQLNLLLSNVSASTNQLWCGERVSVSWQGVNSSGAEVLGSWTDAIYLSADDRWDINDILVGRLDQTNGLASNAVYSASANIFVPGVLPGNYHLLVRTVGFNLEGTNNVENSAVLPVPVSMPTLALGTPTNSVFLQSKHARYWQVVTTEANDLRVSLDLLATNGATELYLGYGAIPTRSAFDVKYSASFQPDQAIRVPGTKAGTNYILAYADTLASEPVPFTLLAKLLPFALTGVTPSHGGNAGLVTMNLLGSGFPSNSTAKLSYLGTNGQPAEVLPIQTARPDMGLLMATFDLRGVPACTADVILVGESGATRRLDRAFTLDLGEPENLQVVVVGPSSVRKGSSGIYEVTVANRANQDAHFVSLYAVSEADTNISIELVVPGMSGNKLASVNGFLSSFVPVIPPGGKSTIKYRLQVGPRYKADSLLLDWRARTLEQSVFLAQLPERLESTRQQVLSNTNLYASMPDFVLAASDPVAWQAFMYQVLMNQGFLLVPGVETSFGKSYSSEASCGGPGNPLPKDCMGECKDWCNVGCFSVWALVCAPMTGLSLGSLAPACVITSLIYCKVFCDSVCTRKCTPNPADPNDMRGPIGWGPQAFLAGGQAMSYTIDFENQPVATAAALQVSITNQLAPSLDWKSVEFQEIGFAGLRLAVPAGQSHYEGRVPFAGWTWNETKGWYRGETPLMVDVKAVVDTQTGRLLVTLACSDTNTGTFPSDAYAGFLPPNRPEIFYYPTNGSACCGGQVDTNMLVQPGQGYVSYTVRPRTNLVTGTRIENAASIVFDWNDPIETPTVFNTIDAGDPLSTVLTLPSQSGRTFEVQWAGTDDSGGSGVANYDVYVSSDGTNYSRWLDRTIETSAWCVGQLGHTYYFYSVARDWVGHEQSKPEAPQAFTTVATNAPVLVVVTNRSAMPGTTIIMTNTLASGKPLGAWRFSLGQGAPSGAEINETNGVFLWTPTCSQASLSYPITVWVADSGNTNFMDAATFTVAVSECVVPGLGRLVLRAGDSGRVPVNLISTVPLTNLAMTVEAAAGRLTNLWIEPIVPQICASTLLPAASNTVPGSDVFDLSLTTCSGQFLIGTQQVAWLHFTAVTNKPSVFVGLNLDNAEGRLPDGSFVHNFARQSGRLVIVGEEPLLECLLGTNGLPSLMLYGKPGWYCAIEQKTNLLSAGGWPELTRVTMDELFMPIATPGTGVRNFFRAVRLPSGLARLSLESATGPVYRFKLSGQTGRRYSVEMAANLPAFGSWQPLLDLTLTNGSGWFNWTNTGDARRFFRTIER